MILLYLRKKTNIIIINYLSTKHIIINKFIKAFIFIKINNFINNQNYLKINYRAYFLEIYIKKYVMIFFIYIYLLFYYFYLITQFLYIFTLLLYFLI